MGWRKAAVALAIGLVCAVALVPAGLAGKPTLVREAIDETFPDVFLTTECGIAVETRAVGHQTTRTHDGNGNLVEVFTINVKLTATSAEGTFRFNDVGSDITKITKDGVVHQINGQVPFFFNGTALENPITGEVLKEPTKLVFESTLGAACAALNP
jgi:hypothetical protein